MEHLIEHVRGTPIARSDTSQAPRDALALHPLLARPGIFMFQHVSRQKEVHMPTTEDVRLGYH